MGTGCPIIDALEFGGDYPSVRVGVFNRASFVLPFPVLFAAEGGILGVVLRYQDQAGVRVLGLDRYRYLVVPGRLRDPLRRGMVMAKVTSVSYVVGAV